MTRPAPWNLSHPPTLWLDFETGQGVDDDGRSIRPILGGRRQRPALLDLLETAAHHGATRLMLSGKFPSTSANRPHWLLVPVEGWEPAGMGHYIKDDRPPTGRFWRPTDRAHVEVRVCREWFGTDDIAPAVAREAMQLVQQVLGKSLPGSLGKSPAAAGQSIWAYSLPGERKRDGQVVQEAFDPVLIDPDISELIHRTSGQHRTEHLVEGRSRCDCGDCVPLVPAREEIPGFCYIDGRFMYSALCREIGVGARMLTRDEAQARTEDPYAKGRYRVRFTVPDHWDTIGILGVLREDAGHWHWPNRPGATYETWVDSVELAVAREWWQPDSYEVLEGIAFEKGRPLDNFASRMLAARKRAGELDADVHLIEAVEQALRAILLQTIGAFHSLGRDRTMTVTSPLDVPPEYQGSMRTYGDVTTYLVPAEPTERMLAFHHPEYSSQIWARERARILLAPTAQFNDRGRPSRRWGALEADPSTLLGINGDALYLTAIPPAALPVAAGGGDDGREGRLRVKGWIPGPMTPPPTTEARNTLRAKAEALGVPESAAASSGARSSSEVDHG